jgi:ferritin-like metal-binding protein YciE
VGDRRFRAGVVGSRVATPNLGGPIVFERLNTPQEAYNYKLGAALQMEQKVLEMLGDNVEEARDDQVRNLLRHHQDETREQIANIEQAFAALGWEADTSPCPAIEGLEKEAKATVKKADDSLVDAIILQGAAEVEHHEIGVYENLIINARAMGREDIVPLLRQNLEQEQHTLEEVKSAEAVMAAAV